MMKFLQTVPEIKHLLLLCLLLCYAQSAISAGGDKAVKAVQKPVDSTVLQLTHDEKKWLVGHHSIKIGYDGSLPPYSFINEQGVIDGIAVEIMALLSQRIGAEFVIYPDTNWNSLYRAAAKKKVDVIAAMVNRSDRAKWFNFTKPYLTKSLVIVTRQDNASIANRSDLAGKRVAVVKGYRYVEQMGTEFPTAETIKLDSMLESLRQVDQSKVDAAILFLGTANYLKTKHQLTKLKIAAFFERNSADESIAVRKDWPKLAVILQKGLDSLTDQEVEKIFSKWVVQGGIDGSKNNAVLNQNALPEEAGVSPPPSANSGSKNEANSKHKTDIFDMPKALINPSKDALEIGKMIIVFLVVLTLFMLWLLLARKQKQVENQKKAKTETRNSVRNLQADHHDDMHLTIVPMVEDDEIQVQTALEPHLETLAPEPVLSKSDLEAIVPAPIALDPHKLAQEKQTDFIATEQISYQRDEDGNFNFISSSIKTVLGYSEADFMANFRRYLTENPINRKLDEFVEKSIQGQPNQICEIEIFDADGDPHWLKVTGSAIYNGLGHCIGIQGSMLDITSEKLYGKVAVNTLEAEGEVIKASLSQSIHESLQEAIYRAEKSGNQFSVIFLSLERMRFLNGAAVNPPPDEVLKEASKRLRATLRDSDRIIEIDDDKFVLLLPETTEKSAKLIGEKISKILQVPYLIGVQSIVMNTAMGFAAYPDHGADPESLIKKAQVTSISNPVELSAAKNKKAPEENLSDDASLQLQQDLVYALDECKVALRSTSQSNIKVLNRHSQFVLHYQSRHSLSDYSINGFEALIRWQHPELGLLKPKDFVDLVKDIGLLDVMTYWIIQQVSFQALDWESKGVQPGVLAVNLGDLTIKQAIEVKKIAGIVRETGAKPEWLTFSIQEQDLVKDMGLVASVIRQLVEEGFQVGIDNLKSAEMLDDIKQLSAQVVEIEPALIRYLPADADNAQLVSQLMTALHDMGKIILAKEIENERQLEFLRNNGCDVIQGHLLSRPMPAKEAKELMENLPDFAWYLKQ